MKSLLIFEPKDFSTTAITILKDAGFNIFLNDGYINILEALQKYNIIFLRLSVKIDKTLLLKCETIKCKYLVIPATGIDHIDEHFCLSKGIQVISFKNKKHLLKDVRATAELTIALTLLLQRSIIEAAESTKKGIWNRDLFRGKDIFRKKVGIIGFGRLGQIVSNYFSVFGANVLVYEKNKIDVPGIYEKAKNINQIFLECDIISLHVDYNEENINLINLSLFKIAQKKPIIINTSRGQIINESDLLYSLNNNYISGAALDVVNDEFNFNSDNPLITYSKSNKNLIITPHIGGCTIDSSNRTEEIIANEFLLIFKKNECEFNLNNNSCT